MFVFDEITFIITKTKLQQILIEMKKKGKLKENALKVLLLFSFFFRWFILMYNKVGVMMYKKKKKKRHYIIFLQKKN